MTVLGWFLFANVMFACFICSLVMTSATGVKAKDVEQQLNQHIRYIAPAVSGLQAKTAGVTTAQLSALGSGSIGTLTIGTLTVSTQLTDNGGCNLNNGVAIAGSVFGSSGLLTIHDNMSAAHITPTAVNTGSLEVAGSIWSQQAAPADATPSTIQSCCNAIIDVLQSCGIFS